ncbi:hypothetical protein [Aestuariicoccus sp. MJ-SS9]|uniref:hypothetical protein n=1 Tax=Aestuariicoccus sp. MJ-SS9 TaxID=3079855 RepID=UPI002912276E|nr:hypothetical protein [Aestuariicoccus sp. MJ-SS9]MDU8911665.1 hypothetical protein [Aestuariicoccus sp. MJ-SS9]
MGLKNLAEKVVEYNARLEDGKASKIKPGHVEKVLKKLRKKAAALESEIAVADTPDRKTRLEKKLNIAREHVERAEWLLNEIGGAGGA